MTSEDLLAIEGALGIHLPDVYKGVMSAFPVPVLRGNSHTHVWDDAGRIIELNRELRGGTSGGVKPWPAHFFAAGRGDDGCAYALDLRIPGSVFWIDRCHLDTAEQEARSFESWVPTYFAGCLEYLEEQGIDPNGAPGQLKAFEEKQWRSDKRSYLVLAVVLLVLLVVVVVSRLWP